MAKLNVKNKCVYKPGETVGGDRRYRYKAWWCMSPAERERAHNKYPHSTPGIPDAAYAYPVKRDGTAAKASRVLLWSYEHTKRKVGAHRAATLSGPRKRRKR